MFFSVCLISSSAPFVRSLSLFNSPSSINFSTSLISSVNFEILSKMLTCFSSSLSNFELSALISGSTSAIFFVQIV